MAVSSLTIAFGEILPNPEGAMSAAGEGGHKAEKGGFAF
jgi:hypothetical protein